MWRIRYTFHTKIGHAQNVCGQHRVKSVRAFVADKRHTHTFTFRIGPDIFHMEMQDRSNNKIKKKKKITTNTLNRNRVREIEEMN